MAYFNHAFCKSFLATSIVADGVNTSAFTAGEFGAVEGPYDWLSVMPPTGLTTNNLLFLVQGSFHTQDQIGNNPGHGGYSESIKSKGINPRYVTRLYSSSCQTATAATTQICVASDCAPCGENLFVRLDVKGSPALRFLNHNAYAIGDSSGDAAANGGPLPGLCCADTQEFLDPAMALAGAMQMVLADPIIAPFVAESGAGMAVTKDAASPQTDFDGITTFSAIVPGTTYVTATNVPVTGGTGTGGTVDITAVAGAVTAAVVNNPGNGYTLGDVVTITGGDGAATLTLATPSADAGSFTFSQILNGPYDPSVDPVADVVTACASVVGAYVDSQFGICSFDTRDHYEMEPVQIIGSVLDETGNPCNDCGVITNTEGVMEQMSGETVLRQLLLTEAYLQNPYNQGNKDSARIRQIELSDDITGAVTRADLYKTYYLQHSIPRMNNPSGVFDNDQYVYQIFVKCDDATTIAAMETLWGGIATLCGTYGNPIAYDPDADIIV